MDIYVRPEAHEIGTVARRKVPLAFPASWEHRELTGRDYGIDMIIEVFKNGCATGNTLSLQIKGTTKNLKNAEKIIFDLPVKTLLYSEMFIVPMLLIVCQTNDESNHFYYLWLQEYIRVVLNHDNQKWRENTTTVRVSIPVTNCMPGDEKKLSFISGFPKRIFDWCQFARICEDINYSLNSFSMIDDTIPDDYINIEAFDEVKNFAKDDLQKIIKYINELIQLESIFGEKDWQATQTTLNELIIPSLNAAQELYDDCAEDRTRAKVIISRLSSVSSLLGLYNDYSFSRALWDQDGMHNF